jgi:hypothetical protein
MFFVDGYLKYKYSMRRCKLIGTSIMTYCAIFVLVSEFVIFYLFIVLCLFVLSWTAFYNF